MGNKFIEYYREHGISPVKQDLSNLYVHFAKREKLYRQMGIPFTAFEGKRILEVGPGSGYNTLAFIFGGGVCTLIEPNKTGVSEMKRLFARYQIPTDRYVIKECMVEEAEIEEMFDIVIAEGFLHSIDNSEEIICKLSGYVREGGVIVITCMDAVSMFVEQMKRLACHILIRDIVDYDARVKKCVDFFGNQMKSLKGMSRSIEDWVKDDMLNPAFNNENILSIDEALRIFPENFSFLGSSQKIFTDYSWYKDLAYDERTNLYRQFEAKQHNFLMAGLEETILPEEDRAYLKNNIEKIRKYAVQYEEEKRNIYIEKVITGLSAIHSVTSQIGPECAGFVAETIEILKALKEGRAVEFQKYKNFYTAVGRTQQYLSMVKNKKTWSIDQGRK